MLCKNCNKEIGQQASCQYCGFSPALDSGANPISQQPKAVEPKPVKVKLIKATNVEAIVSLVLLFFIPGPLNILLGILGVFRSRTTHSGRYAALSFARYR